MKQKKYQKVFLGILAVMLANLLGASKKVMASWQPTDGLMIPAVCQGNKVVTTFPFMQEEFDRPATGARAKAVAPVVPSSDLPAGVTKDDWQLQLVNRDHPVTTEPTVQLVEFAGQWIAAEIFDPLTELFAAANKAGINLELISGYRSIAHQEELFQNKIAEYVATGLSVAEARGETLKYLTAPGTSEHHTGLAVDVIDDVWAKESGELVTAFGSTEAAEWLAQYAPAAGFIIRYPLGKTADTYIEYEPWHLRYVGVDSARYLTENNLSLEEYHQRLSEN